MTSISVGEMLERYQQENDQLRAENERLNKQINSYKMLTKSLEETKTYLLKKADQNKEAVETLASEREANAALTGENEELKRKLAAALAACEERAKALRWYMPMMPIEHQYRINDILAIKPDASALKAHDEALIEKIAKRMADSGIGGKYIAEAIRELKGML